MRTPPPEAPLPDEWTLIRNARQLLTLQGPSGPRQGSATTQLSVVDHGAILIRNGLIVELGSARRVENLSSARLAHEIDAAGGIILPAFIDASTALISALGPVAAGVHRPEAAVIRTMSKKSADARVAAAAEILARHGCLTAGARTPDGTDLSVITKVLRAHQARQGRPLRIRSVISPRFPPGPAAEGFDEILPRWLTAVRSRKLGTVVEFDLADFDTLSATRAVRIAAGLGFSTRFRSLDAPVPDTLRLAAEAGATAVIAPSDSAPALSAALANAGGLRVYPASEAVSPSPDSAANIRNAISAGAAIALCADSHPGHPASAVSMESLIGLAVRRLHLTVEEAITAVTWNPSCALRLSQAAGSIESGKQADLVVLSVPDYRELSFLPTASVVSLVLRKCRVLFPS